ncbi:AraC-like DNA-binding protein [Paenibacillus endophyticus]|uniref:AraC-like DNA-binding protein n=1 Tax=Paenibacillus endophyticus TaxID=1294268 RepID=A0A7W5CBR6_9BACL|nr:AraC family transcriptional regulator [Paenibacillus endophyticus]MBB3154791.1 AraC-like DNA-binding protein [Paenibacillus endophyticus]
MNRTDTVYTHPNRIADFDVFLFVLQGCMQVIEEGKEYKVRANEHLFLKSGKQHWGLPATSPGTTWLWIHFHIPFDRNCDYRVHMPLPEIDYYQLDHYKYLIPMPKYGASTFHSAMEHRLKALAAAYAIPEEHGMTHISIRVFQLFLDLQKEFALQSNGKERKSGSTETISKRVMAYLMEHCEQDFDSMCLAGHMNLNYSYLSSAFKAQTGRTIVDAHARLRIGKAIDWMLNSSHNVSEISEQLGYSNPYYFSRVFKKVVGESPSAYMRSLYRT